MTEIKVIRDGKNHSYFFDPNHEDFSTVKDGKTIIGARFIVSVVLNAIDGTAITLLSFQEISEHPDIIRYSIETRRCSGTFDMLLELSESKNGRRLNKEIFDRVKEILSVPRKGAQIETRVNGNNRARCA